LLELLVAMLIFSVLLAYTIPTIRHYQREAVREHISGDFNLLSTALRIYHGNHGQYPAEKDYQSILMADKPRVLAKPLADPFSDYGNTNYIYKVSPNQHFYLVYSVGLLGNGNATISDAGKITFQIGDPRIEKWESNGKL